MKLQEITPHTRAQVKLGNGQTHCCTIIGMFKASKSKVLVNLTERTPHQYGTLDNGVKYWQSGITDGDEIIVNRKQLKKCK